MFSGTGLSLRPLLPRSGPAGHRFPAVPYPLILYRHRRIRHANRPTAQAVRCRFRFPPRRTGKPPHDLSSAASPSSRTPVRGVPSPEAPFLSNRTHLKSVPHGTSGRLRQKPPQVRPERLRSRPIHRKAPSEKKILPPTTLSADTRPSAPDARHEPPNTPAKSAGGESRGIFWNLTKKTYFRADSPTRSPPPQTVRRAENRSGMTPAQHNDPLYFLNLFPNINENA